MYKSNITIIPFEDTVNSGHDNKLTILYKKYINPREHIS